MLTLLLLFSFGAFAQKQSNLTLTRSNTESSNYKQLYTVQLGAFQTKEEALNHAKNFDLDKDEMGIVYIKSNSRYWYALAYGVYESGQKAIQMAKEICSTNGHTGCWARNLDQIKTLAAEAKTNKNR